MIMVPYKNIITYQQCKHLLVQFYLTMSIVGIWIKIQWNICVSSLIGFHIFRSSIGVPLHFLFLNTRNQETILEF